MNDPIEPKTTTPTPSPAISAAIDPGPAPQRRNLPRNLNIWPPSWKTGCVGHGCGGRRDDGDGLEDRAARDQAAVDVEFLQPGAAEGRSEEHTSELQSPKDL